MQSYLSIFLFLCFLIVACHGVTYNSSWASIDSRPLPDWYDTDKIGIFAHWGVFSVPSFRSEWFWWYWKEQKSPEVVAFMSLNYAPDFTYADFASQFHAELFDADAFAKIIKASGAKYFVITSKHHEGYTLFPSKTTFSWNSVDVGPKQDLIGALAKAIRNQSGVKFGAYFSQFDWFHPLYIEDAKNNFKTRDYVNQVSQVQMRELVSNYQPEVIWSDGDWGTTSDYWRSTDFLAWLYNDSPVKDTVVVNDRWGNDTQATHGGFYSFGDKYDPGHLIKHKWECCMTLDKQSWGFRRTMTSQDVLTDLEVLTILARVISCNGNLLLNIGPTAYGRIPPIFEERLRSLGDWLRHNGEGIYHTKPWIYQNDTIDGNVWYTSRLRQSSNYPIDRSYNPQTTVNTIVYAILLKWPSNGKLVLGAPKATDKTKVQLLGHNHHLSVTASQGYFAIDLNEVQWTELYSTSAWVIKLEYLGNDDREPLMFDQ